MSERDTLLPERMLADVQGRIARVFDAVRTGALPLHWWQTFDAVTDTAQLHLTDVTLRRLRAENAARLRAHERAQSKPVAAS